MTNARRTLLIVDDDPLNRKLLETLLRPEGYRTRTAANGVDALISVMQLAPDLILLDAMMPEIDGYSVARTLKGDASTAGIPIIMLSAQRDPMARLRGLEAGAEDFLAKPVDRAELWLRVRNLLRLKELSDALAVQSVVLEQQVVARTAELQHLAHYDSLTGLPNRALFYETLRKTLAFAGEQSCGVAVLFIDVDDFKTINDTRGHADGDSLLRQFGDRLVGAVRVRDTVGRLGGDEFGVILMVQSGEDGAASVAGKIAQAMQLPFDLDGTHVSASASIGIALYPDDAIGPDLLLQYADTAMYSAKQAGRNTFRFSTAQMNADVQARVDLESALRTAVDDGQFVLHYQPKVDLGSGRVRSVEALLRWERPGVGLVPPCDFIPALETTGLILRVGAWVIEEACRQIGVWLAGPVGAMPISVNVSARQFSEGHLVADVTRALEQTALPGHLLELELTESLLMTNTDQTIQTLETLKRTGVRVSVDDFGTGYSSLAYLRRFPIDTLKIDIAFVRDITVSAHDAAMALAIIHMAHSMKLDVVAEGVETAAQAAYLRRSGCDQMQGYFFSRPLPIDALNVLLDARAGLQFEREDGLSHNTLLLLGSQSVRLLELKALLVDNGYQVLSAQSADAALELLALHDVQVVVCDQSQGSSSDDVLDLIRDMHPRTRRIIIGGAPSVEAVTRAVNRGAAHGYYTESWEPEIVVDAVRSAFRRNRLRDVGSEATAGTLAAGDWDLARTNLSSRVQTVAPQPSQ